MRASTVRIGCISPIMARSSWKEWIKRGSQLLKIASAEKPEGLLIISTTDPIEGIPVYFKEIFEVINLSPGNLKRQEQSNGQGIPQTQNKLEI